MTEVHNKNVCRDIKTLFTSSLEVHCKKHENGPCSVPSWLDYVICANLGTLPLITGIPVTVKSSFNNVFNDYKSIILC